LCKRNLQFCRWTRSATYAVRDRFDDYAQHRHLQRGIPGDLGLNAERPVFRLPEDSRQGPRPGPAGRALRLGKEGRNDCRECSSLDQTNAGLHFLVCAALPAILLLGMTLPMRNCAGHGGPGAGAGNFVRRNKPQSPKLRLDRDPWSLTVIAARAGAAFPMTYAATRSSCSRMARGDRRRRRAHCDLDAGKRTSPMPCWKGHTAPIAALGSRPVERQLASAGWDQTVRLWPLAGVGATQRVLDGHTKTSTGGVRWMDAPLVSVSYVRAFALAARRFGSPSS